MRNGVKRQANSGAEAGNTIIFPVLEQGLQQNPEQVTKDKSIEHYLQIPQSVRLLASKQLFDDEDYSNSTRGKTLFDGIVSYTIGTEPKIKNMFYKSDDKRRDLSFAVRLRRILAGGKHSVKPIMTDESGKNIIVKDNNFISSTVIYRDGIYQCLDASQRQYLKMHEINDDQFVKTYANMAACDFVIGEADHNTMNYSYHKKMLSKIDHTPFTTWTYNTSEAFPQDQQYKVGFKLDSDIFDDRYKEIYHQGANTKKIYKFEGKLQPFRGSTFSLLFLKNLGLGNIPDGPLNTDKFFNDEYQKPLRITQEQIDKILQDPLKKKQFMHFMHGINDGSVLNNYIKEQFKYVNEEFLNGQQSDSTVHPRLIEELKDWELYTERTVHDRRKIVRDKLGMFGKHLLSAKGALKMSEMFEILNDYNRNVSFVTKEMALCLKAFREHRGDDFPDIPVDKIESYLQQMKQAKEENEKRAHAAQMQLQPIQEDELENEVKHGADNNVSDAEKTKLAEQTKQLKEAARLRTAQQNDPEKMVESRARNNLGIKQTGAMQKIREMNTKQVLNGVDNKKAEVIVWKERRQLLDVPKLGINHNNIPYRKPTTKETKRVAKAAQRPHAERGSTAGNAVSQNIQLNDAQIAQLKSRGSNAQKIPKQALNGVDSKKTEVTAQQNVKQKVPVLKKENIVFSNNAQGQVKSGIAGQVNQRNAVPEAVKKIQTDTTQVRIRPALTRNEKVRVSQVVDSQVKANSKNGWAASYARRQDILKRTYSKGGARRNINAGRGV